MHKKILALIFVSCLAPLYSMERAVTEGMGRLSLTSAENTHPSANEMIKIADAEGALYDISKQAAMHSGIIKGMFEESAYDSEEALPLFNISSEMMPRLINMLNLLTQPEGKETIKNQLQDVSIEELSAYARAADYIDAPELVTLIAYALTEKLYRNNTSIEAMVERISALDEFLQPWAWRAYRKIGIAALQQHAPWALERTIEGSVAEKRNQIEGGGHFSAKAYYDGDTPMFVSEDRFAPQNVVIIDSRLGREISRLNVPEEYRAYARNVPMKFSHDGTKLALAVGYNRIDIYDVRTGQLEKSIIYPALKIAIAHLAWSPNGQMIAAAHESVGSAAKRIYIIDVNSRPGELICDLELGSRDLVQLMAFSPNGQKIAVELFGGKTRIYDVYTRELVGELALPMPTGQVHLGGLSRHFMAWSSDGKRLIMQAKGGASIWNVQTQTQIGTIIVSAPNNAIVSAAFSADNRKIRLKLYNADTEIWYQPEVEDFIKKLSQYLFLENVPQIKKLPFHLVSNIAEYI